MRLRVRQGLLWVSLVAALFGLATVSVGSRAGAQETKVRLEVPSTRIEVGDDPFGVEVVVEDVVNLGAFEFNLLYDDSVLQVANVNEGPFLGSSGRRVECLEPRLSPGFVRFVCVTLGPTPAGPDGSGTVAVISFEPTGPGISPLQFETATVTHPDAEQIPAVTEDASVGVAPVGGEIPPTPTEVAPTEEAPAEGTPALVSTPASAATLAPTSSPTSTDAAGGGGINWALWGPVIGVVAVVVVGAAGIAWWSRTRRAL